MLIAPPADSLAFLPINSILCPIATNLVDFLIVSCCYTLWWNHAGFLVSGSALEILFLLTKMNKKDDLHWQLPAELLMLQALTW